MAAADPKLVVKVFFVDESFKTLAVPSRITAAEMCQLVAQKIDLSSTKTFSIVVKKDTGEERFLEDTEEPCQVMVEEVRGANVPVSSLAAEKPLWDKLKLDFDRSFRLQFKRRAFIRENPVPIADPTFLRYTYLQAVSDVVSGNYPVLIEDVSMLASLHMQVTFGEHSKAKHVAGFISRDKIHQFVPRQHLDAKRPEEWECMILLDHSRLLGLSLTDAMHRYLTHVRSLPFYGSTFFSLAPINEPSLPPTVILGINSEGILLLRPGTKELLQFHSFGDIYSWAFKRTQFGFISGIANKTKFLFETVLGRDIIRTLACYVDLIREDLESRKLAGKP